MALWLSMPPWLDLRWYIECIIEVLIHKAISRCTVLIDELAIILQKRIRGKHPTKRTVANFAGIGQNLCGV